MATKISAIAFANSVKCGRSEELIFLANIEGRQFYDIEIVDTVRVRIQCLRTNDVTFSSLFNAKWWKEETCEPKSKKADEQAQPSKTSPKSKKL